MDGAFAALRSYARSHQLRLSDVAQSVVYPPHLADAVLDGAEHAPPA
jgi:hypothetical protein